MGGVFSEDGQKPLEGEMVEDEVVLETRWGPIGEHFDWATSVCALNEEEVISGGYDKTARWWKTEYGRDLENTQTLFCANNVRCITKYEDTVAFGESTWGETKIEIFDLNSHQIVQEFIGHDAAVLDLYMDDNNLVSCSADSTIRVWDRHAGISVREHVECLSPGCKVFTLACKKNDGIFAFGCEDNKIRLYKNLLATDLGALEFHTDKVTGLCQVSGPYFASCSYDKKIHVWDVETKKCIVNFNHSEKLIAIDANQENQIAVGDFAGNISIWDVRTKKRAYFVDKKHKDLVQGLQFSPDNSNVLFSAGKDKRVRFMDLTMLGEPEKGEV